MSVPFSSLQCKYTTKSDVWSFGVLLWEILGLAAVRPFAASDDRAVLARLSAIAEDQELDGAEGGLDRPRLCPRDFWELMQECWRRAPADRPAFSELHLFLRRKSLAFEKNA